MTFPVEEIRRDFPALNKTVHNNKPLIYLDNAATAQMPRYVWDAIGEIELCRGNVHRGIHAVSEQCTAAYERAREQVAAYINAKPEQVRFTSGTTDGVNQAAEWLRRNLKSGERVAVTRMEHHSNFVPWQQVCLETGAEFVVLPLNAAGELDMEAVKREISNGIKLLAVAHGSNVLGAVNDVAALGRLTHEAGGLLFVDGAQGICHESVDVVAMDCDFYAFSGHKLGAPFGIGALYTKNPLPPVRFGGGMVETVLDEKTIFDQPPQAYEAGTPNVAGAVGLAAALEYRKNLPEGWQAWEQALMEHLEDGLRSMERVHVLGQPARHSGCISFVVEGASPYDLAVLLDQLGIAVRSGHHCAQPLLRSLGQEYALRVSPAFYNTMEEIDAFLSGLERVMELL
jgi:cysteine desulfurase / selenocysteine lyase